MSYHFVASPFSISKEMTQTHARTHAAYHQLSTNDFFSRLPTERKNPFTDRAQILYDQM